MTQPPGSNTAVPRAHPTRSDRQETLIARDAEELRMMRSHAAGQGRQVTIGVDLIAAERARQIDEKGHDEIHDQGRSTELMDAAVCYVEVALLGPDAWHAPDGSYLPPGGWPWSKELWQPTGDPARELAKAGALIAAAIDALKNHNPKR